MPQQRLYVLAPDPFETPLLEGLRGARHIAYRGLLDVGEAVDCRCYDVPHLMDKAHARLAAARLPASGIMCYWDFPTMLLRPILCRDEGLPGPSLESVLKCSHKYWSRLEQRVCIPDHIPDFALVDPFAEDAETRQPLPFPFWLKPVCSHSSMLGFLVHDAMELRRAIQANRENIGRLGEPLNRILEHADLPPELAGADGYHCIAESLISAGDQCTLEGHVLDGEVHFHGAIDSLRMGVHNSSFSRYQYPSALPRAVHERMAAIATRFLWQIGFDDSPFNIEFFHDPESDRIYLLEANPRVSKSHSWLFHFVDGAANHQISVDVALGQRPDMPYREGEYACAAKFMLREHEDAYVRRAPTVEEIGAVEAAIPGVRVTVPVRAGMHLNHLMHQDSYSFEIAKVFVGGDDPEDLEAKCREVERRLHFRFETSAGVIA